MSSVAGLQKKDKASQADLTKNKTLSVLEAHGYVLGKTIGSGSYATVKFARSVKHNENVAIKIVSKGSAPADYLKKFLPREIQVVKGLRHPHLIRFRQAIETTHRVYIVMEYAENGSLLEIIRKDRYIDEIRAKKWFKQLTEAVDYCHERGVVHRDIKCENVLMDLSWNVKLTDFGFARANIKSKSGTLIYSETFCGSYAYASPEILRGIPYQPQYADVWSMGVVLFAMVYGRLPFDDSSYKELIKQVSSRVIFPKEPKVSSQIKTLINKILAPLKSRIKMNGIKQDPWCISDSEQAGGSSSTRTSVAEDEEKTRKLSIPSDQIVPQKLVTKELLEQEANPRDRRRRSTLEESTIAIDNISEKDDE